MENARTLIFVYLTRYALLSMTDRPKPNLTILLLVMLTIHINFLALGNRLLLDLLYTARPLF
jgi:hypothetical protein